MTNYEYIKNIITERDLAYFMFPNAMKPNECPPLLSDKIYEAWSAWAQSSSPNKGNMAKGNHNGRIIKDDPSIWMWEIWAYPDGTWRYKGRNSIISFLVWLSKQYNPAEWTEED